MLLESGWGQLFRKCNLRHFDVDLEDMKNGCLRTCHSFSLICLVLIFALSVLGDNLNEKTQLSSISEILWDCVSGRVINSCSVALTYKLTNIMPLSFKVNHSLIKVQRRNFFPGEDHMPICLSSMPACSITLTGMAQKMGRWYTFRGFFFFVTSSEYERLFQHQTGSPLLKPFKNRNANIHPWFSTTICW